MKRKTEFFSSLNFFVYIIYDHSGVLIRGKGLKDQKNFRFTLTSDLALLRLLSRPTCLYDVVKELGYARSSAYCILHDYLDKGIVDVVAKEKLPSGLEKKYFKLTDTGFLLLDLTERIVKRYSRKEVE